MPNLPNDKRVEALLKQEMVEHQSIISSHHKEMQTLRDSLKVAMDRFDSLYERLEKDSNDISIYFNQQIMSLKDKVLIHEKKISEQKETILSLYQQLQGFHLIYSNKIEVEKLKKDLDSQMKEYNNMHLSSLQNCNEDSKSACVAVQEVLSNLKLYVKEKFCELHKDVETKFNLSKIDKDRVLKEIRIYEKSQFIIEKKIENIYTLIERMNKRGAVCPKPE
jgi:hypothetical protein